MDSYDIGHSCYVIVHVSDWMNEEDQFLKRIKSGRITYFSLNVLHIDCNLHAKNGKLKVLTFRFWIYIPIKGEYSEYLRLTRCNGIYLQQDIKGTWFNLNIVQ